MRTLGPCSGTTSGRWRPIARCCLSWWPTLPSASIPTSVSRLDAQQAALQETLAGRRPSACATAAAAAAMGAVWRSVVALNEDDVRRCGDTIVGAAVRALSARVRAG